MLRSEAMLIIKRGLGFRQTQDTAIIAALKEAQRDLELGKTLPNWLVDYDVPISVTSGNNVIDLPTGFIRLHDDYDLYRVDPVAGNVTIKRRRYDEAYQAYVASGDEDDSAVIPATGSFPKVYSILNKLQAVLIPTPMVSFTAYLSFYKAGAVLDSDIENEWLKNAPNYLVALAGMTVAGNLRDKDALVEFTRRAKMGGSGMMGDIIEDELAGRPMVLGRNN